MKIGQNEFKKKLEDLQTKQVSVFVERSCLSFSYHHEIAPTIFFVSLTVNFHNNNSGIDSKNYFLF